LTVKTGLISSQRLQVAGTLIYFDWFNHKSTKKC